VFLNSSCIIKKTHTIMSVRISIISSIKYSSPMSAAAAATAYYFIRQRNTNNTNIVINTETDRYRVKFHGVNHGRWQDFLCRGKVGAKPRAWGKEKSILLNIERVRKLKY